MLIEETALGPFPALVGGEGPPLVMLAGLWPETGVGGSLGRSHTAALRPFIDSRHVYYLNRRPGLPDGITLSAMAAEMAEALVDRLGGPFDLLGTSTGGSIAQQLAADHPGLVRRLVLISTACHLTPGTRLIQRRIAARVRAGADRQALALLGSELVPPWRGRYPAAALAWSIGTHLFSGQGLEDMARTIEAEDTFDLRDLATIRQPTLIIGGGRDRFYPTDLFEETRGLIPGAILTVHPRRGHLTVAATPRTVAEVVGFLGAG
jgi:pimeloyl-ACP methyl ester carboxylesterase